MTNLVHSVHQTTTTTVNRSFDSTISSTQETYSEPLAKRPREEDDITIQEASEIMKMLLETNPDMDVESKQVKTMTTTTTIPNPVQNNTICLSRAPTMPMTRSFPNTQQMPLPLSDKDKPKFLCRFCGRSLSTQGRINKHENECNDNPDREIVECEVCHLQLKPSSLSHHRNTKHGSKGKPALSKSSPTFKKIGATNQQLPTMSAPPSLQIIAADKSRLSSEKPQTQRVSFALPEEQQAHHQLRSEINEPHSVDLPVKEEDATKDVQV